MSKENLKEVVLEGQGDDKNNTEDIADELDTLNPPFSNNNIAEPESSVITIDSSMNEQTSVGSIFIEDQSCASIGSCTSAVVCSEDAVEIDMPSQASHSSTWSRLNDSTSPICRICHGNGDEEELLNPCRCSGSVMHAHQSCLIYWISQSGESKCELCKYPFKTKKKKTKQFWKWRFPRVTPKGWLHVGLFLAFFSMLTTSMTWILWSRCSNSASAIAERSTSEVKFAYMLNGIFIAIALGGMYFDSMKQIRRYCKKWSAVNQEFTIEDYEEGMEKAGLLIAEQPQKTDEPQGSSSVADLASGDNEEGQDGGENNDVEEQECNPLVVHETWV